jgi:hypothetical protein
MRANTGSLLGSGIYVPLEFRIIKREIPVKLIMVGRPRFIT